MPPKPAPGVRRKRRRLIALASPVVVLGAVYGWQPQRIQLWMPEPPPVPRVDPESERLFSPRARVAVVVGHPDDPEFYIGGLLTKLGAAGARVRLILCTDGDKAYYPPGFTDVAANRQIRRREQQTAAARYGADVRFLARPDGRLTADDALVEAVARELSDFRPDYVLGFDTEWVPRLQHRDHLEAGRATDRALVQVPGVRWHGRFSTRAANHYVDISAVWPAKRALLAVHASQFANKRERIEGLVGGRAQRDGAKIGVAYAEGLRWTGLKAEPR